MDATTLERIRDGLAGAVFGYEAVALNSGGRLPSITRWCGNDVKRKLAVQAAAEIHLHGTHPIRHAFWSGLLGGHLHRGWLGGVKP